MGRREVTRTFLELRSADQLRRGAPPRVDGRLAWLENCPASFYRYLYNEVGRSLHWVDRRAWDDARIRSYLAQSNVSIFVLYVHDCPAGYFELLGQADGAIEIVYFGLLTEFHGLGLGRHLLAEAVNQAFAFGACRVCLQTCTLDGPAALPNYLARGFVVVGTEVYWTEEDQCS